MATKRKIVEIDEQRCDGCGQCATACAEGALEIRDGKARLIKESYCDGLGACLGECPRGAVRVIEKEADEFDPEAVEKHLVEAKETAGKQFVAPRSCPSSRMEIFLEPGQGEKPGPAPLAQGGSELSHWPVQIRLIPPNAPFLKGAHLLVVSDCAPVAYPNFHRKFVGGKAVMLGCPKFDNAQEYKEKFAAIFRGADIRGVTVIDMEVPCCSALPALVREAMEESGKKVPFEEIVISVRGEVLKKSRDAA